MKTKRLGLACLAVLSVSASAGYAVEGGMGAYLLGSRTTFSGIVPGPGTYVGLDVVTSEGSVEGLSLAGLPIRADSTINLTFAKLSVTTIFDANLWGGAPAINVNIPFVFDAELSFVATTPPIERISEANRRAFALRELTPFHVTDADVERSQAALRYPVRSDAERLGHISPSSDPLADGIQISPRGTASKETPNIAAPDDAHSKKRERRNRWRFNDDE